MATQKDRLYDVRTIERNREQGLISAAEYEKYMQALPDTSDKSAPIEAQFVEGVLERDEDQ
ncbi:MAG: hypothetical protein H0U74_15430 [Bradymonadaceae bacterium]|nr:hypothetical protein [Lujinxingiaceae bacterium]